MELILEEPKKIFPGEGKNSFYDLYDYDVTEEELQACKDRLGIIEPIPFEEFRKELEQKRGIK